MWLLKEEITEEILEDWKERIRSLQSDDFAACFQIPVSDLLLEVVFFEGLDAELLE